MKRLGALALFAAVAAANGCATQAKYIEKNADSGVVAVPDTGSGPGANRQAALDLIEKHVGPNYEIVSEGPVTARRQMRSGLPNTDEPLNPRNQAYPAQRAMGPNASFRANPDTQTEVAEYRITYKKSNGVPAPRDLQSQEAPTGGAAQNVQPVGGINSAFNRPTVRPAAGGADCDH